MPALLNTADPDFEAGFAAMLVAKREDADDVGAAVADIIAEVRARGDAALVALTARFDRTDLTAETLRFSETEIDAACARVDPAERAALDPLFVAAVVREESSFDPRARSRVGARGLMQLMPDTARPMARERGLPFQDGNLLEDPGANLEMGSAYMGRLIRDFGDPRLAVAAYNAGPRRVVLTEG